MASIPGAETTLATLPTEDIPKPQENGQPADVSPPNKDAFITVQTTLPVFPLPSGATRGTITTPRLLLRVLTPEDLLPFHRIRTDPEIMIWTVQGRPDRDTAETQAKLDTFLPPNDVLKSNWAIVWRETGEMIGIGGVHDFNSSFGWPEIGYMLRREFWGMGLASEFLGGWLGYWRGLEREVREVRVDGRTVTGARVKGDGEGDGVPVVEEQVIAITERSNAKSHGVLRKCGFEMFCTFHGKNDREGGEGETLVFPTWRCFPGRG